ncbi:hypothetical protein HK104_004600 [Borealophlyctis nickersoniae]|nr:hypothetical protein HK104_004600 [Borealophlyctis nickersoniae]
MADNGSGTTVGEAGTTVAEAGTAAEEDLRTEPDPEVTTWTARVKPTETRLPLHSEPQNPARIFARIPVFTKFVHPHFKKPKAHAESDAAKAAEKNTTGR